MSNHTLTKTRLFEGVWEGHLTPKGKGGTPPEIEVTHLEQPIPGVEVLAGAACGGWIVRVPVPTSALSDGVQTFLIHDQRTGVVLDSFTLMAGDALGHDIRAELALLRAELDMLKRAFRRHCLDTA